VKAECSGDIAFAERAKRVSKTTTGARQPRDVFEKADREIVSVRSGFACGVKEARSEYGSQP